MVIGESFRIYNFMITLIPAVLSKLYFHKAEGIWMNRIQKHWLQGMPPLDLGRVEGAAARGSNGWH
jgi:hypothetical protein